MLLDWTIHTSLIQKRLSYSYQSKHHMFLRFLWFLITYVSVTVDLVLQD